MNEIKSDYKFIEIGTCFILIKLVNWLYGRTI
jgi:hypothetical protein